MNEQQINELERKLQKIQAIEVYDPKPQDHMLGGIKGEDFPIINSSGKWHHKLPESEKQFNDVIDFFNCVTQSGNNIIEILDKFMYGIKSNYSDRWAAKKNGTTRNGNNTKNYAESIRKKHDGLIAEKLWTWKNGMDWNDFYKLPPDYLDITGEKWADEYDPKYKIVSSTSNSFKNFVDSMKISPQHWAVKAWYRDAGSGLYYSPPDANHNHAVCGIGFYTKQEIEAIKDILIKYESYVPKGLKDGLLYPAVFDSYPPFIKFLTPHYNVYPYTKVYKLNKLIVPEVDFDNMTFYKKLGTAKIYQLGMGDKKYHYINEEPIFNDLYGKFEDHKIIEIEIKPEQIAKTLAYKENIINLIFNLFKGKK